MSKIQVPASHQDLLDNPSVAELATVDSNHVPQVTAVWFLVDDDGCLKTSFTEDRQKYKNVVNNPYVSMFIVDPQNPFRTLEIRAKVEIQQDPDYTTTRKFAARYGVPESFLIEMPGTRVVAVLEPIKVVVFG